MMNFSNLLSRCWLLIRRDWPRKLIALVFALLVYGAVQWQLADEQKLIGVPVEIRMPSELVNLGPPEIPVTVNVRGPKRVLRDFDPAELRGVVEVDINRYFPGVPYRVQLQPGNFRSVNGVSVTGVDPAYHELVLNLQRRVVRSVAIQARFRGQLGRDYKRSEVRVIPSQAQVTGPESLVRELREISTVPIVLDESVTESFEYTAVLEAPEQILLSPARATVQVDIVRNFERRVFPDMPVMLLSNSAGGRNVKIEVLDKPRVDVTVNGLAQGVAALRSSEVNPYLDISALNEPGVYTVTVGCYVKGDGVDVKEISPENIRVKVTKQ